MKTRVTKNILVHLCTCYSMLSICLEPVLNCVVHRKSSSYRHRQNDLNNNSLTLLEHLLNRLFNTLVFAYILRISRLISLSSVYSYCSKREKKFLEFFDAVFTVRKGSPSAFLLVSYKLRYTLFHIHFRLQTTICDFSLTLISVSTKIHPTMLFDLTKYAYSVEISHYIQSAS